MASATEMLYGEKNRLPCCVRSFWYRSTAKALLLADKAFMSSKAAADGSWRGRSDFNLMSCGMGASVGAAAGVLSAPAWVGSAGCGAHPAAARAKTAASRMSFRYTVMASSCDIHRYAIPLYQTQDVPH